MRMIGYSAFESAEISAMEVPAAIETRINSSLRCAKIGAISSKSGAGATTIQPKVTIGDDSITVDTTKATGPNGVGMWCTDKAIDLTPYKTLVFEGTFASSYTSYADNFVLGAWSKIPTYYTLDRLAYQTVTKSSSTAPVQIDVSSIKGRAYIGIGMAYSKAVITKCYLIPKEA